MIILYLFLYNNKIFVMKKKYILGIVGSRYYNNYNEFIPFVDQVVGTYGYPIRVVSGGAKGVDTLAKFWAGNNNIPITEYLPDWKKYGKAAGPIRNKQIVANIDVLLAIVAPNSVGTLNTIKLAEKNPNIKIIKIFLSKI